MNRYDFFFFCNIYIFILILLYPIHFFLISGLVHTSIIDKMRVLSMLSLAVQNKEIQFSEITSKLELEEDDIEEFIIDCKCICFVIIVHNTL